MSTMKTVEEWKMDSTHKREVEIGRLLAHLKNGDKTLMEVATLVQEQLNLHRIDAFKAGMTEVAEVCHNSIQPTAPYFKALIETTRDRKDLSL